jgi:hypothetical protein
MLGVKRRFGVRGKTETKLAEVGRGKAASDMKVGSIHVASDDDVRS